MKKILFYILLTVALFATVILFSIINPESILTFVIYALLVGLCWFTLFFIYCESLRTSLINAIKLRFQRKPKLKSKQNLKTNQRTRIRDTFGEEWQTCHHIAINAMVDRIMAKDSSC